jgi:hypothetical protein
MTNVSVRLIQATLLEFFHYYSTLYFQTPFTEIKAQHTVGFQPKAGFYILPGYSEVVIGYVIIGPGIILTACQLQRHIIIGNVHRTSEHQVFEQMSKACMLGMFVAGSHII